MLGPVLSKGWLINVADAHRHAPWNDLTRSSSQREFHFQLNHGEAELAKKFLDQSTYALLSVSWRRVSHVWVLETLNFFSHTTFEMRSRSLVAVNRQKCLYCRFCRLERSFSGSSVVCRKTDESCKYFELEIFAQNSHYLPPATHTEVLRKYLSCFERLETTKNCRFWSPELKCCCNLDLSVSFMSPALVLHLTASFCQFLPILNFIKIGSSYCPELEFLGIFLSYVIKFTLTATFRKLTQYQQIPKDWTFRPFDGNLTGNLLTCSKGYQMLSSVPNPIPMASFQLKRLTTAVKNDKWKQNNFPSGRWKSLKTQKNSRKCAQK